MGMLVFCEQALGEIIQAVPSSLLSRELVWLDSDTPNPP